MTLPEAMQIVADVITQEAFKPAPKCEYRSPQFDGGTQQGRMIQCRSNAVMWTDRGLRCEMHRRD